MAVGGSRGGQEWVIRAGEEEGRWIERKKDRVQPKITVMNMHQKAHICSHLRAAAGGERLTDPGF